MSNRNRLRRGEERKGGVVGSREWRVSEQEGRCLLVVRHGGGGSQVAVSKLQSPRKITRDNQSTEKSKLPFT